MVLSLLLILVLILVISPFYYLPLSYINPPGKWPTSTIPNQLRIETFKQGNSALPREYIVPDTDNPVVGKLNKYFGKSRRSFSNSLYIGWVLIILAAIGIFFVIRRKRRSTDSTEGTVETDREGAPDKAARGLSDENRFAGWGFIVAAIAAFLMSIQPHMHIGSIKTPLPSSLFSIFVPWLRWYMRISIVLVLCLIVLACFGLSRILDKLKRYYREALLVSLTVILAAEMLIVPPFRYIDLSDMPKVFKRLSTLPKDSAIVFYPAYESGLFVTNTLMNFQREFQKPMLNGAPDNSDGEALRRTVFNPYDYATPGILRRFNIDYLVNFKEQAAAGAGTKKAPALPPGLELVQEFGEKGRFRDADIYRVTAPMANLVPVYLGDITIPRTGQGNTAVRLVTGEGIIRILNFSGKDTGADLELPISNDSVERTVIIKSGNKILWQRKMTKNDKSVARIPDLTIPRKGKDLHIIVNGPAARLPENEYDLFGTAFATVVLGDLRIVQH
jgi:hypothetical protein